MIFAIEIDCLDASNNPATLYFATDDLTTGTADTPAHTAFEPSVGRLSWMGTNLFRDGATRGASQSTPAEIELANVDGHLDDLIDYSFGGRAIRVRAGNAGDAYPGAWTDVIVGTVEQPTASWASLRFRVRDRAEILRLNLQDTRYAGDNSLPAGLEGTADDLKDQRKPLIFGQVKNVALPCCNTSHLIYQANDGAVDDVPAVYDNGSALTQGADYTSQSDMETTAPAAGNYRVWPAGGYVRLGSTPAGQITADINQAASGTTTELAALIEAIVAQAEAVTGETIDLDAGDLANIAGNAPFEAGLDATELTIMQALDLACASAGAWYSFDALGAMRLGTLDTAYGDTAPLTLVHGDITAMDLISTNDADAGIPIWRATVRWARNHAVQTEVAGSLTAARRAWLAQEWRRAVSESLTAKARYLLAPEIDFDTALNDAADASALANRYITLYGTPRMTLRVTAQLGAADLANLRIGGLIKLESTRFLLDPANDRGLFRIVGLQVDLRTRAVEIVCWGGFSEAA